ncbi:MAG: hypothetical protein H0W67_00315 [Gemmatimonadales bacterium]|nr:hypothetical protein [Gemmatimonadales bacterium]
MNRDQRIADLTELLTQLGAPDPAAWARSEVEEELPQLARYLFLTHAWRHVVDEGDESWIDAWLEEAERQPRAPGAAIGPALRRLLAGGAARSDLTDLVRVMQYSVLFNLCLLVDDPPPAIETISGQQWALVEVDQEGTVGRHIAGLHDSLLETDPTGREMRPQSEDDGALP